MKTEKEILEEIQKLEKLLLKSYEEMESSDCDDERLDCNIDVEMYQNLINKLKWVLC